MARAGGQDRGIFERPPGSGIWWILYYAHGQRHREKVGSKAEARVRYRQRKEEIRLAKFDPEGVTRRREDPAITVGELVEHYLPEHLRGQSVPEHSQRYARFWIAALGKVEAGALKPGQVEAARATLLARVSAATANRHMSFLIRIFNLAIRDEMLATNAAKRVGKVTENNERVRALTKTEEERLRAQMEPWAWRLVKLAIETGMRQSEQFGLRREDVDLATGFVRVRKSKHGKQRFVALNRTARAILAEVLTGRESEWVFPGLRRADVPLDAHNFYTRVFRPSVLAAGIPDLRWHDLRHTYATRLIERGRNTRTVQELGGWKTLKMVERYSHLSPGFLLEAVEHEQPPEQPPAGER